jgi:hypothetical protein
LYKESFPENNFRKPLTSAVQPVIIDLSNRNHK